MSLPELVLLGQWPQGPPIRIDLQPLGKANSSRNDHDSISLPWGTTFFFSIEPQNNNESTYLLANTFRMWERTTCFLIFPLLLCQLDMMVRVNLPTKSWCEARINACDFYSCQNLLLFRKCSLDFRCAGDYRKPWNTVPLTILGQQPP